MSISRFNDRDKTRILGVDAGGLPDEPRRNRKEKNFCRKDRPSQGENPLNARKAHSISYEAWPRGTTPRHAVSRSAACSTQAEEGGPRLCPQTRGLVGDTQAFLNEDVPLGDPTPLTRSSPNRSKLRDFYGAGRARTPSDRVLDSDWNHTAKGTSRRKLRRSANLPKVPHGRRDRAGRSRENLLRSADRRRRDVDGGRPQTAEALADRIGDKLTPSPARTPTCSGRLSGDAPAGKVCLRRPRGTPDRNRTQPCWMMHREPCRRPSAAVHGPAARRRLRAGRQKAPRGQGSLRSRTSRIRGQAVRHAGEGRHSGSASD